MPGETPDRFIQVSMRVFGRWAEKRLPSHPQLGIQLSRAGNTLVPSAYLAGLYMRATLAALAGLLMFTLYMVFGAGFGNTRVAASLLVAPIVFFGITYSFYLLKPELERRARQRDLEANLPYALNFMGALASAGIVPEEVFGVLSRQEVYGDMTRQAGLIHRDTRLFGRDLITAMRDAARRSPSLQFEEFLQGAVSTVSSGGDLKTYFLTKAEHFSAENHRKQRAFLESMGVMAESYVVVAAAAPLFLIVIISVMVLLQEGLDAVFMLNLIVLIVMPVVHGTFTLVLRGLRPD